LADLLTLWLAEDPFFDNAGIAASVVERRVRGWRGAWRFALFKGEMQFFGPDRHMRERGLRAWKQLRRVAPAEDAGRPPVRPLPYPPIASPDFPKSIG